MAEGATGALKRGASVRANTMAVMWRTPTCLSASAAACKLLPVVITSSSSTTLDWFRAFGQVACQDQGLVKAAFTQALN
jgi:hypothetical protein